MKKQKYILLFLFLYPCIIMGQNLTTMKNNGKNPVQILSSDSEELIIQIKIEDYQVNPLQINNENYYTIKLNNESGITKEGYPDLPFIEQNIAIPPEKDYSVEIISSIYEDVKLPIAPYHNTKQSRQVKSTEIFADVYSENLFYPNSLYSISEPYYIRQIQGIHIGLYPFAYNPFNETLRIYKEFTVKIEFQNPTKAALSKNSKIEINSQFEPFYNNHFINYHEAIIQSNTGNTFLTDRKMLIIFHERLRCEELNHFVEHKKCLGIPTDTISVNTNNTASIQNIIRQEYNKNDGLTYILLMGSIGNIDSNHIYYDSSVEPVCVSDVAYTLLNGTDYYPDALIGRFPAKNTDELKTMINRTILYERAEENQAWTKKIVGIAADGVVDTNGNLVEDKDTMNMILDSFERATYYRNCTIEKLFDNQNNPSANPTAQSLLNVVNNGTALIYYIGHGSQDSWQTTGFGNTDIENLNNTHAWPVIFSVACDVGDFRSSDSFSENWLTANKTPTQPTGAVAMFGSSSPQPLYEPITAMRVFNQYLINGVYSSLGELCFSSSIEMYDAYHRTTKAKNSLLTWNIFGDPSIAVIPNVRNPCCEKDLHITNNMTGGVHYSLANDSIVVSNIISNNANIIMGANRMVKFSPGFEISGSNLIANNNGCFPIDYLSAPSSKPEQYNYQQASENKEKDIILSNNSLSQQTTLYQNIPNPFNTQTEIKCFIQSDQNQHSCIRLHDLQGRIVKQYNTVTGENNIIIKNSDLESGIYLYTLYINDKEFDTKRLILNK